MLLQTKLFIPQTRAPLVERQRLIDLLAEGKDRKLILVCAPAGFGKTSLVYQWIQQEVPRNVIVMAFRKKIYYHLEITMEDVMKITGIDQQKCTQCLACVKACWGHLFTQRESQVVKVDPHNWCSACGHCLAACPEDAIIYEADERALEFEGIEHPPSLCEYNTFLQVLQSKRSIWNFLEKDVPREEIEAVLEAMRYAPSTHNKQPWKFIVIKEKTKIQAIIDTTVNSLANVQKIVKVRKLLKPVLPSHVYELLKEPWMDTAIAAVMRVYKQGRDPIFRAAPVIIIVSVPNVGETSLLEPAIAFTYGMLAAHTRGLGTCWIGAAIRALINNRKIKELLEISKNMKIAGVMTLGYPSVAYHRVPPRESVKVKWYL